MSSIMVIQCVNRGSVLWTIGHWIHMLLLWNQASRQRYTAVQRVHFTQWQLIIQQHPQLDHLLSHPTGSHHVTLPRFDTRRQTEGSMHVVWVSQWTYGQPTKGQWLKSLFLCTKPLRLGPGDRRWHGRWITVRGGGAAGCWAPRARWDLRSLQCGADWTWLAVSQALFFCDTLHTAVAAEKRWNPSHT